MSEVMEWKHHPITVKVLDALKDAALACKDEFPLVSFSSAEETALRNAHAKGFLDGLHGVYDAIDHLLDMEGGKQ